MLSRPARILLLVASIVLPGSAAAGHVVIHVKDAWSRATPPTAEVGAAYFIVDAEGSGSDRLIGASTPVAASAEMHTHEMQGSMMRMRRMDAVDVHPEAPLQFAPGGHHVMLIGLKAPLEEGDRFPLTLTFEKAGQVVVDVQVKGPGAMSADDAPHGQHGHAMPGMKKE